eukprot:s4718_g1.t1
MIFPASAGPARWLCEACPKVMIPGRRKKPWTPGCEDQMNRLEALPVSQLLSCEFSEFSRKKDHRSGLTSLGLEVRKCPKARDFIALCGISNSPMYNLPANAGSTAV